MSGDVVARARELLDGTDESPLTIHLASADEIIGVITGLVNEVEKLRRGGKELGRIIERQCRDVLNITGLHHLIGPDGDGDWGLVWERLAEMAAAGAEVEKLRGALETIRSAAQFAAIGVAQGHSESRQRALLDILAVVERAGIEP